MDLDYCRLTVDKCEKMFRECSEMQGPRRKLLEAHFSLPNYTATMREIAEIVGYKNFNAVNLHYGIFAKNMIMEMGWEQRFITYNTSYLCAFIDFYKEKRNMWKLILREEAVAALVRLG
jgi:hypothetical protein